MSKLNVLVYAGAGTTVESVAQCTATLRAILSPYYSVHTVDADVLIKEPWSSSTSLIAIPGGADIPYCKALNGVANDKIKSFVNRGGVYLGFCAGGYYGASRVEFELDNPSLAVKGDRELAFFPGISRGTAYAGFVYNSELGARAVKLKVNRDVLPELQDFDKNINNNDNDNNPLADDDSTQFEFASYYNGGSVFVDAHLLADKNVTVIARYDQTPQVEGGDAAIVHVKVGQGCAILTGPHPEFSPKRLHKSDPHLPPFYGDLMQKLVTDNHKRLIFLKALLRKAGLKVNSGVTDDSVPELTPIHATGIHTGLVESLWHKLKSNKGLVQADGNELKIFGENDTFAFTEAGDSPFNLSDIRNHLPERDEEPADLNKVTKNVILYDHETKHIPASRDTPYFDLNLYYNTLRPSISSNQTFGSIILYSEVITSTSTILDKNLKLLRNLPTGTTAVGSIQISGRGRAGNVWVSPLGLLAFSIVIRHPSSVQAIAPLVFVQYIAAMAIVKAATSYGDGYDKLDIRLKWPNDVYALNPEYDQAVNDKSRNLVDDLPPKYLKLAGVLVNSNYSDNEYLLVVGCGINTANESPTTSLNSMVAALNVKRRKNSQPALAPYKIEILFAKIMQEFESLYGAFKYQGFAALQDLYYSMWLHTGAIVRLEMLGGVKARIKGISTDYGMLVVEELSWDDRPTNKIYTLQPDGNSFDMFKGLLKRKEL
ncbi:biotin-protein ligase [Lipomyces japonicus]|uniref:biotin-protein ligase n=1 Tax=Lipomyces japonicus TaxID=56871 RepID=UPI0034CE662B